MSNLFMSIVDLYFYLTLLNELVVIISFKTQS